MRRVAAGIGAVVLAGLLAALLVSGPRGGGGAERVPGPPSAAGPPTLGGPAAAGAGTTESAPAGPGSGEAGSTPDTPATYRVVDEDGRPVAGARVLVYPDLTFDGAPRAEVVTDRDGRFTAAIREEDALLVRATGFATEPVEEPRPLPAWIVLREGFRVAGVVVDGSGAPIAGARILPEVPGPVGEFVTEEDGRFVFEGLWYGPALILSVSHGNDPVRLVEADSGDEEVRIVCSRPWTVRGVVVLPGGETVPRPTLGVQDAISTHSSADDGSFALSCWEGAGNFRLEARATQGDVVRTGSVDLRVAEGEERLGVRITLDRERVGRGALSFARVRVLADDGSPLVGAWVRPEGPAGRASPAGTDFRGVARMSFPMPAGFRADVTVVPPEASRRSVGLVPTPVTLTTGEEERPPERVVRLERGVAVTFVFRGPGGEPLPEDSSVQATLTGGRGRWVGHERPSDSDRTTLWAAPGETFTLHLQADGFVEESREAWSAPMADAEVEVRLGRGAGIRGRLVAPDWGAAAGGEGFVAVHPWAGSPAEAVGSERWLGGTAAGADGKFHLRGLRPGRALVVATAPGLRLWASREVVLLDGQTSDLGDLPLGLLPAIRGAVLDSQGKPLGAARVFPYLACCSGIAYGTSSHGDGSFRMRIPSDAIGYVLVGKSGYGSIPVPIVRERRDEPLTVILPPEGSVRASVRGALGDESCSVNVSRDGEFWWDPRRGEKRDVASGDRVWELAGLPPGPIRVRAEYGSGVDEKEVLVVAGQTTEVVLEPRARK
ncbi:MAG: carboxypeptidase-like regulatory domain-containing protein [Planctomycetales bacterium]|nr:carboxypeptidase-like regulatory domain-containing protein [Planctomycetales bacterium]